MYYLCFDYNKRVSFSSAGRFVTHSIRSHPKRILNNFVLLLGYSGECRLCQDTREYTLKKGTFQILFPDTLHYGTMPTTKDQSHFWCHFYLPDGFFIKEAEDIGQLEENDLCVLPEFSQIEGTEKLFVLFSQLIDEAEKAGETCQFGNAICDSYTRILLLALALQCKETSLCTNRKRAVTAKLKAWLKIHACDGISAGDAANALGYNSDYLTQILKSGTGMTLCEYLNDVRLKEAKNALLNSSKTVSEIAYEVGFSDEKYFMKLFKRKENVTPTQYRNAHFRIHLNK